MISTEEKRRLNKELREECWGYSERGNKPDGAYIKEGEYFFNINKIKRLIEAGADVNAKDVNGESPLYRAVDRDSVILAKYLISAGANVNAKDIDGYSPLYYAVDGNNKAIAKLLIKAGVDVIESLFIE